MGVLAESFVTLGGIQTNSPIAVGDVTDVGCAPSKPTCPASGQTADTFLLANRFRAIVGIGLRKYSSISSPLPAMGATSLHLIELPRHGGSTGALFLDPLPTRAREFTKPIPLPPDSKGLGGWDDTQFPFCFNAFCAKALLDTGAPTGIIVAPDDASYAALGVDDPSSLLIPPGTVVSATLAGSGPWSFTVGSPPTPGLDFFSLRPAAFSNNLSVAVFHAFDVLYDRAKGTIAVLPKP
jgi:hypothetical protein